MSVYKLFTVFVLCSFWGWSQQNEVLLTIDNQPIYTSEFLAVYNKNKALVVEESEKDIQEYLDLFLEYQLKVKKAKDLDLDTITTYQNEVAQYKKQLLESFLYSPSIVDSLVNEAYNRTKYQVSASHILIRTSANASAQDTLKAYNELLRIKKELTQGLPFEEAAKKYSQDPSAKLNAGYLGFFEAFDMVYPFENAAYHTPVGHVSQPVRTSFGYHLIKVNDKRKSKGKIDISHIMVLKDSVKPEKSKTEIDDIYNKLLQGADFAKIARSHSDDKRSAMNGGKLPRVGEDKMIKAFNDVAFNLKEEGKISQPFETAFGWHILKLNKSYPVESLEAMQDQLRERIVNGKRATYLKEALVKHLESEYQVVFNKPVTNQLYKDINYRNTLNNNLLTIDNKSYSVKLFNKDYNIKSDLTSNLNRFKDEQVIAYHLEQIEAHNQEYAKSIKEYQDGLLLFELLQTQVWQKANTDSIGVEHYFDTHHNNYRWKRRADVIVASCTQEAKAIKVKELLEMGLAPNQIKEKLNEGATIHVLFSEGKVEENNGKLPEEYEFETGVSKIFSGTDHHFTIIKLNKIYPASQKTLSECRGAVINDYQTYLEEKLTKQLKQEYHYKWHKKVVRRLKKMQQS